MAYTTIDDPTIFFNTITWVGSGNSSRDFTGVGFAPDLVWVKNRGGSYAINHSLYDRIRGAGANKELVPNNTTAEGAENHDSYDYLSAFGSDGFSSTYAGNVAYYFNESGSNYVGWNWKAGGSAPAITYTVKVVSDSGNKYRFDDFGTSAVTLDLQEGGTYTFDQSDSSNSGHPLRFYTASDKSGGEYTTGVTTTGTAGSSGAKTVITVAASAPTLYYQCSNHAGMGGQANTNSTFGSSNFSGSIQSTVSANTTAGFSIVKFTSSSSSGAMTVGHGLGATPKMVIVKDIGATGNWQVYFEGIGTANQQYLKLNATSAVSNISGLWGAGMTSSLIGIGVGVAVDASESDIAYCFAEKKGYSKMGAYRGSSGNSFIYTGFKPAFLLVKSDSYGSGNWRIYDNKRSTSGFNVIDDSLRANTSAAEIDETSLDFVSNGFKYRANVTDADSGGTDYIYMAFAESPFVNSNGVPTNAR